MEAERARALDPLPTDARGWGFIISYMGRRYDKLIEDCEKTLELAPDSGQAHSIQANAYGKKDQMAEAIAAAESGRGHSDSSLVLAALGRAYALAGKHEVARRVLAELEEQSRQRYVCAYEVAVVDLTLGNKEQALRWLAQSAAERSD